MPPEKLAVEIWSPLPPQVSGVADYVEEQLDVLNRNFALTVVVEVPGQVGEDLKARYRLIAPAQSNAETLRLYHVGNSPLHGFIYREVIRVPGVVVLHEWNLHELLLGFAVTSNDFDAYRLQMRREHGERGSVAAETLASALGGRYWTGAFPLNAEILGHALAVVTLSGSSAAKVAARVPGTPLLHLPHHALLRSHAASRAEARIRLGLDPRARIVLAPGLGTTSKSLDIAESAMALVRKRIDRSVLVTVGGGESGSGETLRRLGRVDLETLGDALLAADVVLALRFPSRGEASGVVMRALAAGRALIVSSGSTADEDLPDGVVARVNPGPAEGLELAALLEFLLTDDHARIRMELLSSAVALSRGVEPLTSRLAGFLREVACVRASLESKILFRESAAANVRGPVRAEIEAAARSLGLTHLPSNVFEKLAGL